MMMTRTTMQRRSARRSRAADMCRRLARLLVALAILFAGAAALAAPTTDAPSSTPSAADQSVETADAIKLNDFKRFTQLLDSLEGRRREMGSYARWKLQYLLGWRAVYLSDYGSAKQLLEGVADDAPHVLLRFRALATLVNLLGESHRYQQAFTRLTQLQELMPSVNDPKARFQALGEASQLLGFAGQFDQAETYARAMIANPPKGETACKGAQHLLRLWRDARHSGPLDPLFDKAIDVCFSSGDVLFGSIMRGDVGWFELAQGRPQQAIDYLMRYRDGIRQLRYKTLTSDVESTLAQAHLALGQAGEARRHALAAVADAAPGEFTEPLIQAYRVLYEVERDAGNLRMALGYHERFATADKAYLTDVGARSLAFQMVDQQVAARRAEVTDLNRQNEILRLQRRLDQKEVETGRLYILVLVAALAAVGWLVVWLRRSQVRFMHLARRDGLTGICNREHFVDQARRVLAYGARSDRGACLILFDLDHFKQVNDTYGHAVGDEVLKRAVDVSGRALHACDVFGRLGGEEFAVLLPDCDAQQARARAEQLRLSIAATSATPTRPGLAVTASFGVAPTATCGFDLQRLLVVADSALYRAKRGGRNCVFVADSGDVPDSPYLAEAPDPV